MIPVLGTRAVGPTALSVIWGSFEPPTLSEVIEEQKVDQASDESPCPSSIIPAKASVCGLSRFIRGAGIVWADIERRCRGLKLKIHHSRCAVWVDQLNRRGVGR